MSKLAIFVGKDVSVVPVAMEDQTAAKPRILSTTTLVEYHARNISAKL